MEKCPGKIPAPDVRFSQSGRLKSRCFASRLSGISLACPASRHHRRGAPGVPGAKRGDGDADQVGGREDSVAQTRDSDADFIKVGLQGDLTAKTTTTLKVGYEWKTYRS